MRWPLVLAALSLTTCAHNDAESKTEIVYVEAQPQKDLEPDVKQLKEDVRQLQYYIDHDKCFISYAICLGEKKVDSKVCWNRHETCVVDVYHQWKKTK